LSAFTRSPKLSEHGGDLVDVGRDGWLLDREDRGEGLVSLGLGIGDPAGDDGGIGTGVEGRAVP
jgi:hypothetical protein